MWISWGQADPGDSDKVYLSESLPWYGLLLYDPTLLFLLFLMSELY